MKDAWLRHATAYLRKREHDGPSWTNGLVIVESPFAGDVARNRRYLKACLRDSLRRGEFPFASHAIYTQVLDDRKADERRLGIRAGLAWAKHADATVIYADLGISRGMAAGISHANERGRTVTVRYLGGAWAKPAASKRGKTLAEVFAAEGAERHG